MEDLSTMTLEQAREEIGCLMSDSSDDLSIKPTQVILLDGLAKRQRERAIELFFSGHDT